MINKNNKLNEYIDNEGIAIIGLGFRLPSGDKEKSLNYSSDLWNSLMNGFDGVIETNERWSENFYKLGEISNNYAGLLPLDEWKSFDPLFFGINPSEVPSIDPQQRLLLKCTWEALEDAMIDPIKLRGSNTSVFIGASTMDYQSINKNQNQVAPNIFGSTGHTIANRISYCFDFNGQSITVDSACSSSLNAVQLGCSTIQNGTSNVSIVGGVNLILDSNISKSFSYLSMLSKSSGRCMSFDADADGFIRSEGAGVVVLKSLKQAIKDGNNIYCVINGSSSNVDGNGLSDKSNFYSPSSQSQADNIRLALQSTNGSVNASDIDYIEAHGTGTPTGDPIELEGISMVFKHSRESNPLFVGSIKSNIGHCEAASGVASLIKCCLMFKHQCFAPNINFNTPNPSIKFNEWNLKVVTDPIPFNSNKNVTIAINNFGVTGSNCCLILSQHKSQQNEYQQPQQSSSKLLIPFSGNSVASIKSYQSNLFSSLDELESNLNFNEFAKIQVQSRSTLLYQRSVILASNWDEFKESSNKIETSDSKSSNLLLSSNKKNPITVFVFCGQGSQYNTMALELYNNNEIFKQSMDLLDDKLFKHYGYSVLNKLRSIKDDDVLSIHDPINAQPTICMVQASLFQLYKHWGIEASFIIGHSLGEVTAAYCSGMIDIDTFCYVVYHRSVLQSKTNGCGKMLSISISADEFQSNYSTRYPSIEIACYNSPTSIVIAGNEQQLIEISTELKENGIFTAILGSLSSFHTSSQSIIKDQVINVKFESKQPSIPIYSTTTANLYDDNTPFTYEYVYQNIIEPVYFNQTIANLYKHIETNQLGNEIVFIEIAPHQTLSFYLKQMIPNDNNISVSVYSPLHKKKNDTQEINQMIANLYCQNRYNIDFKCQFTNDQIIKTCNLPHYQWDDEKYWKYDQIVTNHQLNGPPIDHLGLKNESSPLIKSYQTIIDIAREPFQYLKGHVVKNKFYFPGCGYIDNLLKIYKNQNLILNYLEFKSPFILSDGINQYLQSNIYQTGKSEFKIMFHYKELKTNEWIQSSTGNFQLLNNDFEKHSKQYDIQKLKDKCNFAKLTKNELYESIKMKTSLSYNSSFKGVEECYLGDQRSLSILPIKVRNNSILDSLNTPILDCCLHGMIGLINDQCGQIVFHKIEGLKIYSSNFEPSNENTTLFIYSKFKKRLGNSFIASIVVLLIDGTVLIEIDKVTCKSLNQTTIKDPLLIESPMDYVYSKYYQLIDSQIPTPSFFKPLYQLDQFRSKDIYASTISIYQSFISSLLYDNIVKRINLHEITIDEIKNQTIDSLLNKHKPASKELISLNEIQYYRLFNSVFNTIKQFGYCKDYLNLKSKLIKNVYKILKKSTAVISNLLFPTDPTEKPQSLFEDGLLDSFYSDPEIDFLDKKHQLVGEIIKQSIEPLINEKMVFRILEFGGGVGSLSVVVLDKINQLFRQYPNYEIDIEYTWSDISASFIPDAKKKLHSILNGTGNRLNLIFRTLDLEEPLIEKQQLKPSYYDFVIMSNVLHVIKDVSFGIDQIYKVLSTNGHLLFVEPPYKSIILDSIFGVFNQWWSFEDSAIRNDSCCMNQDSWYKLLTTHNFNDIIMSEEIESVSFIIQASKTSILSNNNSDHGESNNYDQIIVFGNDNQINNGIKIFENFKHHNSIIKVSNISEFKILEITDKSIVYFIKTIDQLNLDNFKFITLEYIQINQILLQSNSKCKHVLITMDSQVSNYLSSSVKGAARYFEEFQQLQLFTIDYDLISIKNDNLFSFSTIESLISPSNSIHREFFILENKIYFERYKKEIVNNNVNFKSNSFESNPYNFYARLTPNLQYKLNVKKDTIKPNQIEVRVLAAGINYKDYLVYCGLVDAEICNRKGDIDNPEMGIDFSGIITRIGSDVKNHKVDDQVFGIANDSTSSHVVIDKECVFRKPSNISHCEAASIPAVYVTSLFSMFNIGNLDIDSNESVLIHSATGGVGLSALEILKWKGHKAPVFVTVGSDEKKQYLLDHYGDFITGIYSTRNQDYVFKIKQKLKEINQNSNKKKSKQQEYGVDLILNTLSSDFMNANFSCLNISGRIVDLSITHLNTNEYVNNINFKYNYGYHNVELLFINKLKFNQLLKSISNGVESGKLKLIPIIEFSNNQIKDAIEFINQRKHIGKIVVNNDSNILDKLILEHINSGTNNNELNPLLKSNYFKGETSCNKFGSNIIVTGQSGIILEILKWITRFNNTESKGVKNIIILTKSSMKWETELLINQNKHIKFHFKSVDVAESESVEQSINDIISDDPTITNIDSIFHYGFQQIACHVNEIDMHHLDVSHGAKTIGAINLHNQSIKRGWKVINFIMASSIASIIGSSKQCSYVCANSVLDSLSRYRNSIGLPSICTNWGSIGEAGFVMRYESVGEMLRGQGLDPISTNKLLGAIDIQIQNQKLSTNLLITNLNFPVFKSNTDIPQVKFDFILNSTISSDSRISRSNNKNSGSIKDIFLNKVSEFLSVEASKINTEVRLIDYGVDSLLTVQLKNWIDKEFLPNIITIQQIQNNSIKVVIETIINEIDKNKKQSQKQLIENDNIKVGSFDKSNTTNATIVPVKNLKYWKKQIKLPKNYISNNNNIHCNNTNGSNILLYSANGFLGSYLLFKLIQKSNCNNVYCFESMHLILNNLKFNHLYDQLNDNQLSKIKCIENHGLDSKLTNIENLGLISNDQYNLLSNEIDTIVLNINTNDDYETIINQSEYNEQESNLIKEFIKFSFTNCKKRIINISTFYIYLESFGLNKDDNNQLPPIEIIDKLPSGIIQNKLIAEYLIKQALNQYGIPSTIVRIPPIFSNETTGIGYENDLLQLFLQSCRSLSCFPNIDISYTSIPIQWLSNIISNLVLTTKIDEPTSLKYHNINGTQVSTQQIFKILENQFNCKEIELFDWLNKIQESKDHSCINYFKLHNIITKYESNNNKNNIVEQNDVILILNDLIDKENNTTKSYLITNEMITNHLNNYNTK